MRYGFESETAFTVSICDCLTSMLVFTDFKEIRAHRLDWTNPATTLFKLLVIAKNVYDPLELHRHPAIAHAGCKKAIQPAVQEHDPTFTMTFGLDLSLRLFVSDNVHQQQHRSTISTERPQSETLSGQRSTNLPRSTSTVQRLRSREQREREGGQRMA